MAKAKQEKKKDGAQVGRNRPQGWKEARSASRSIRRLGHVLRHNGEDMARVYAAKHMLDDTLNRMLRSPEHQRLVRGRSRRRASYPERRAHKRAAKREAENFAAATAEPEVSSSVWEEIRAMIEARP